MSGASSGRLPVTAAILAGGRSSRMGTNKALLPVAGRTLVSRLASILSRVCAHTMVVTNDPAPLASASLPDDVTVAVDDVPRQGPLGGIATALAHTEDEWVLVVAVDMPLVVPEVVELLWEARGDARAVVPMSDKGIEPLLALYSKDCLGPARAAIERGDLRPAALLDSVDAVRLSADALRSADPELKSLVNVNTPEDLAELAASATPGTRPRAVTVTIPGDGEGPADLPSERPVTIHLNDKEIATVQATPRDLEELGVGFLVAEGLLSDREAFEGAEADAGEGVVRVRSAEKVADDMFFRARSFTSGCGKGVTFSTIGHARGLEPLESDLMVEAEAVVAMMREMSEAATEYRRTGGVHSCALGREGRLLIAREDVGRHNALDKVIGRAWLDRLPTEGAVILSTGRISYEMVVKAAKVHVSVLASRTAATDLAAEIADTLGITIAGYARGHRLTVYTHPERIRAAEEGS